MYIGNNNINDGRNIRNKEVGTLLFGILILLTIKLLDIGYIIFYHLCTISL